MTVFFSAILATRDRPGLFAQAMASVLEQHHSDFEVIVVDDGSAAAHRPAYDAVLAEAADRRPGRVAVHRLVHRPRGHGQSYSLNFGAAQARGDYLCFLDDDDCWTDPSHLSRAAQALARGGGLYMANQAAFRGELRLPGPAWVEELAGVAAARRAAPDAGGCLVVTVEDLLAISGFCHVNALIVRRGLFEAVGGMDEGIRWECDRDLFLRLVDRADADGETLLHHPATIARHNVPDPAQGASMTTQLAMLDRWLQQLRVLDKAALRAHHSAIRAHGRLHKGYTLKRIAEERAAAGAWRSAASYARQALGASPTPRWRAFTAYCAAMAVLRGDAAAGPNVVQPVKIA